MEAYEPGRILVTGGCGFIGSHVVVLLVREGFDVVNFDCLDYCSNRQNVAEVEHLSNYKFIQGNILSKDLVNYVMREENIKTVYHFAAQSHVDNSFGNSLSFTEVNVLGTHVLLEAAKVNRIQRFIHVSTDEVYGESGDDGESCKEERMLQPTNPYAASKAAAEFIVKSYARSFNLSTIITRGNNVYGPRQFPEKIIPKFILRLSRNLNICIHGDGSNRRNYVFVDDAAKAYRMILTHGIPGHIYNVGSKLELTNLQVAEEVLKHFGHITKEEIKSKIEFVEDRKINDKRYNIDSGKLLGLQWEPETDWNTGITKTIEWYNSHPSYWSNVEGALVPHPTAVACSLQDETRL